MSIELEITHWDGKSADDIRVIHDKYRTRKDYVSHLVKLIQTPELRTGASWLLKTALESGATISKQQVSRVYSCVGELDSWEQKLHILQSFEYFLTEPQQQENIEYFLRACISDENKFVRAWAYSGFYYFAKQCPEFQEEVIQFFNMALEDEAPSVKARIRQLKKLGF